MAGIKDFTELQPNTLIEELISFIEQELILFPSSKEFINILETKRNENQHSHAFCVFMTNECRSKFYFGRETPQKGSSVIDIGIYKGDNLIFTIEAKLLPTPKGSKKVPRYEHEYVYGKGSGIQRFKEEKHGLNNSENLLSENGLIAFIKQNDFDFWFEKINQWILDAKWTEQEKLEKIYFDSVARLKSKHTREKGSQVILHHFWLYVSKAK